LRATYWGANVLKTERKKQVDGEGCVMKTFTIVTHQKNISKVIKTRRMRKKKYALRMENIRNAH
jgi:hypothetical protein